MKHSLETFSNLAQCSISKVSAFVNVHLGSQRSQKTALTRWEFSGNSYWPASEALMLIAHCFVPTGRQPSGMCSFRPYSSQTKVRGSLVTITVVSPHISIPRRPISVCARTIIIIIYRITGNFRGRKLSQIVGNEKFAEKNLRGSLGANNYEWVWPSIFAGETFADSPKTTKFVEFSPSKISRYTVCMLYISIQLLSCVAKAHW